MTIEELFAFATAVNGDASMGDTLLYQLLNLAKSLVEHRRPWMVLRSTDTTKAITSGNTWQTAIDLSTIPRFDRFYGKAPIRLYDGNNNIERYTQVSFEERLENRESSNTFCYDEAGKVLYLNGRVNYAGFLYIHHIKNSPDLNSTTTWSFPSWAHPLLAFVANGIYKGGIDFDDVNRLMAPDNRAQAALILNMLEAQDSEKQLSIVEDADPYPSDTFRSNSISIL